MRTRKKVIGLLLMATLPAAHAEMKAMSDQEMGEVTGQSMLGLDVAQTSEADFTRYTVGMEADFQMNMEELAVGETDTGADVAVDHLSFGHIARQDGQQFDGKTYSEGDIVPFIGRDPYLELAENNGDVVGFRVGFTEARGTLSGDISTLTGRLGIELEDANGNVQQGQLLHSDGTANNQLATHYGLADSADCSSGGEDCAALNAFETLEVGNRNANGNADFTNDFFLSFQDKPLEWQTPGGNGSVQTDAGVFMNVPTAMRVKLQKLTQDVVSSRKRTEYIDRGKGLF